MRASSIQLYRRLLSYVSPYRSVFIFTFIGMAVVAATQPVFPYLLKVIIDNGFIGKDDKLISMVPVYLILLFTVRGAASFVSAYGMLWVGRNVIFDVRQNLFRHLIYLPIGFFDATRSSSLIRKVIYDVEQIASASTNAITTLIKDGLTVVLLIIYLFYLDSLLTMIFIISAPFIALYVRYISTRYRVASESIQGSIGGITQIAKEVIQGQRIVKTYGGFNFEINNFNKVNTSNQGFALKKASISAISVPIVELFIAISLAGLFTYMISMAGQGSTSVGEFVAYVTSVLLLMPPLRRLIKINEPLQMGVAGINSIFSLLDEPREIDEGTIELQDDVHNIEYRNVSFRYPHSSEGVLNGLSFKVNKNEMVALVGASGSGKTTITSLLPRFYEPGSGSVLINGIDIRRYSLRSLRKQIAIVPQETILFDGSIAENITYGCDGLDSDEYLKHAVEAAHINEFISRLKDGLNTDVGEHGAKLSGGQRQRVSIARALYKNSPILILDEATSSLDTISERHFQDAMENLLFGRTTLVIAHRLSTIMRADKIIVVENGLIVEQGTHDELLQMNGFYSRLYNTEFNS